jgi:8-oxo-dGTP pyrophosphatase MutT (NUDIX family)/thiol-disulfide isomerase/thioredoxin
MPAPWVVEADELLLQTRIFGLRRRRARSTARPGVVGDFVVVDAPDWVNVIALTDDGQVVLVAQHRHGTGAPTLEIPGGMVDPGEGFVAAGLRELEEETGYGGGEAELIGVVEPNPAFQSNRCGTVLVRGARLVGPQKTDEHEEIDVSLAPLAAVPGLIRGGQIAHALVVAAFHHLHLAGARGAGALLLLAALLLPAGPARAAGALALPVDGLDDCCTPKAVAAVGAISGVRSAARDPDGRLCVELDGEPSAAVRASLAAALAAAGFRAGEAVELPACPAAPRPDPWAGAEGLDFAVVSRGEPFAWKAHLAPGKVTLFEFGAPWCAPCHDVAAGLTAALRAQPGLAVRAVVLPGDDAVASFGSEVARQHLSQAPGIPWIVVRGPKGQLRYAGEDLGLALKAAGVAP